MRVDPPSAVHGSPPRAWGPPRLAEPSHVPCRFTPTGVGTTLWRGRPVSPFSVHPHGRGDHGILSLFMRISFGSPPRAWGPPAPARRPAGRTRFTPTGVGTTFLASVTRVARAVHPHGRGDHTSWVRRFQFRAGSPPRAWGPLYRSRYGWCESGSPPRAWGPQYRGVYVLATARFTPTGVGTTLLIFVIRLFSSVHPHGRGDHLHRLPAIGGPCGSPPRAWGPLQNLAGELDPDRFTPTGVGTTRSSGSALHRVSVHPHGRGDHGVGDGGDGDAYGSPPRAWGPQARRNGLRPVSRFTPTGVGTTLYEQIGCPPEAVHPHGRGDHSTMYCWKIP